LQARRRWEDNFGTHLRETDFEDRKVTGLPREGCVEAMSSVTAELDGSVVGWQRRMNSQICVECN
jgi:hypothetical protein